MDEETEIESSAEEEKPRGQPMQGQLQVSALWHFDRGFSTKIVQILALRGGILAEAVGHLSHDNHSHDVSFKAKRQIRFTSSPSSLSRVLMASDDQAMPGDQINVDRFLPLGIASLLFHDWSIGPTVMSTSSAQGNKLLFGLQVKKSPAVLRHEPGFVSSWIEGKLDLRFDAKTKEPSLKSSGRIKLLRTQITQTQDLQISVGIDAFTSPLSAAPNKISTQLYPFLRVSENSFSIKLSKDVWSIRYDLT